MSIKTLRKRIALVAVSALGVGLLSVAPASAAQLTNVATGQGLISATATCEVTNAVGSTTLVAIDGSTADTTPFEVGATAGRILTVPRGVQVTLAYQTGDYVQVKGSTLTVSSLNDGTTTSTGSINAEGNLAITSTASTTVDATVIFTATTVGATTLVVGSASTTTATTANKVVVNVVTVCTTATYDADESEVSVASDATDDPANDNNVDVTLSAEAGSPLYIRVQANNAYGSAITSGTLSASATNGALLNWGATQATVTAGLNSAATVTPDGTDQLRVDAPSEKGMSTVVTILHNGVAVATKTLTFYGEVASIEVVKTYTGLIGTSGAGGTTGFFLYQYKDAAGNVVPASGVTIDATTVSAQIPTATSEKAPTAIASAVTGNLVNTIETAIGDTTYGVVSFACGATAGSGKITIETTNAVSEEDISKEVSLSCFGGIDTYVVSTDKASYNIGEIATITITAKDSKGNPAADASTMGATETVSVGGGSLTKAVAAGDAFTGGVRTYKAQMTTAGTFNVVVTVSGTTTKSATAGYSIKDASAGVTNAEVLAAIVKLIASINKQIKALQKSLKK